MLQRRDALGTGSVNVRVHGPAEPASPLRKKLIKGPTSRYTLPSLQEQLGPRTGPRVASSAGCHPAWSSPGGRHSHPTTPERGGFSHGGGKGMWLPLAQKPIPGLATADCGFGFPPHVAFHMPPRHHGRVWLTPFRGQCRQCTRQSWTQWLHLHHKKEGKA